MPGPSITCPKCGRTSWHPQDVARRYCAACHKFHADMGFPDGGPLTPTGLAYKDALAALEKTRADMIADLTPILGERDATSCTDTLLRSAIRHAKRMLNLKEH